MDFVREQFGDFDENSLNSQRVDRIRAPVFTAKGREPVKPNKRFKPFENAFVSKQKGQNTEESTKHSTKWAVTILKEWIKESDMDCEGFELWPEQQLDNLLEMFYSCIRTQKGKEYSRPSLIGIRAGINRYLTDPPFSRKISLMKDSVFTRSNRIIEGRIDYLKRKQLDVSEHKEPINESDMKKLYQSGVFSTENPKTLQRKVQFELLLHFGRRGREGLRYLKKDSFALETDSSGVRYVTMRFNDGDKTRHGLDDNETVKKRKMYEQVGDKHCPVLSFLKYVSKLNPMCDAFFQRPMSMIVTESHKVWYGNQPVGINTLNTLMPRLSADAGLSMRYTNHCIEATRKSTLQRAVVSNTAIISVKGNSLKHHRIDRIRAPVVKAKGREAEQTIKRFKPFENAFVSKQKVQTEESTKTQTKWAVAILNEWMKESDVDCEGFELWPEQQLDNLLEMFYSCVRTQKGKEYSRPSLIGIRAGINRYLTDPPFSRKISLMKDSVFSGSNRVIEGRINYLKREQLDVIEHKEPINENDMKKLYQSGVFTTENPKTLQQKVQFEIMLHFGRRGREGLRYLKKDSFTVETDSSGVRYVTMTFIDGDKTRHGLDDYETVKKRKMYEQVGDKHCPVLSFLKYVSKLNPTCDAFFQRPMSTIVNESHNVWYGNQPVGINTLNTLMPRLSADACLSMRYTNLCIKATMSTWQRAGVSNTAIMSETAHKNVQNISSCTQSTEKDISRIRQKTNVSEEQF